MTLANTWLGKCTIVRPEAVSSHEDCYCPTLKIIIDPSTAHSSANIQVVNYNKYYCFPRTNCNELNGMLSVVCL